VRKIDHNVLNAKQHQREAEVVAAAGLAGNITDCHQHGRPWYRHQARPWRETIGRFGHHRYRAPRIPPHRPAVAWSRRSPRRPGKSSQFYVSLEDDLMRLFGSERISKIMDRLGIKEGEVIQHSMITKSITNAQTQGRRKQLRPCASACWNTTT
jgi:preprotein translocase subunit SecA